MTMASTDEEYIVVPDPKNPSQSVRAKLLRYRQTKGQDNEYNEYTLDDGTKIRLFIEVESIYRRIDPTTGKLATNPKTGEPQININWGVRIMTVYSEKALREIEGRLTDER